MTYLSSLSGYVQRRWGSWGILFFILWALVLAFVAFARMLLLTAAVELQSTEFGNQAQVWLVFIINALLGIGFGAGAFGLWQRANWGRLLFLAVIIVWSGFNLTAVLIINPLTHNLDYTFGDIVINSLPAGLGLIVSLWYFNLPHIKAVFKTSKE